MDAGAGGDAPRTRAMIPRCTDIHRGYLAHASRTEEQGIARAQERIDTLAR